MSRTLAQRQRRAMYARADNTNGGFKNNTPGGWVSTNGPVWFYGDDKAYLAPNDTAHGYSAITKATSVIVNRIAASRWSVAGEEPRWVSDPMLTRPDDRYTEGVWPVPLRLPASYFWGQYVRSALLWGMGNLIFTEDRQGQPWPGSMALLSPWAVDYSSYGRTGDRFIRGDARNGYTNVAVDDSGRFRLGNARFRLLELRNPILPIDTATGATPGVLEYHAAELGIQAAIAAYTGNIYNGAGIPSGYLKVNAPQISEPMAKSLKETWQAAHGSGNRSVAVLNGITDYQAISVSPVDAALADMTKLSLMSVANAFCVPLFMLGAPSGDSKTYSNVQMEQEALWTHTLQPWARAIEDTLSALLPAGSRLSIELPKMQYTTPAPLTEVPA